MINEKKVYTYFINRFAIKKTTNGWFKFDCPICIKHKPNKMAVHFEHSIVKCWLCGYKESIIDFVGFYEDLKYWEAKKLINELDESDIDLSVLHDAEVTELSEIVMPYGFVSISEGIGLIGRRARGYIAERGFDLEVLDRLGFGYCNEIAEVDEDDYFGRIIIPYKKHNHLTWYQGRAFLGQPFRYKNPPKEKYGIGKADLLFNEDALDLYETIFVTEGWADALTFGKYGVATAGWSLSTYQLNALKNSEAKRLIFVPDAGTDGEGTLFYNKAVETAAKFLDIKQQVYVINLNSKHLAAKGKDANEIGKPSIIKELKESKPLDMGEVVKIIAA